MILGQNGILNRAQEAKEKTEKAQIEEQSKITELEAIVQSAGTKVTNPPSYGEMANAQATADGAGKYFALPLGAKYIEGTVDTGVVVEIKESEFVWISVDDVIFDKSREEDLPKSNENTVKNTYTPMCIMVNGNYRGMFYNQLGNKITLEYPNNENYQGKENEYIEPDIVPTDTEKNSSYGISSDGLQREYNKMIESVSKYKGFYVARYEAGIDKEGNIVFKDANITENEVTTVNADNEKIYRG